MSKLKQRVYFVTLPALLAIILVLPIRVPYTVSAPGKVLAAREWIVIRQTDGRLMSILVDHKRGVHRSYAVSQFERGDAVQFNLRDHLTAGARVVAGDTIGVIHSNQFEYSLVALEGELAEAMASLELSTSGEKESVVAEAERKVKFATKALEEQQRIATRLDSLYHRNLVSREEYEIAADEKELREIKVAIAEAQLQSVTSGAKSEQIALIQSRIRALNNEIATLRRRLHHFTLISPISGTVNQVFSADTMLVISDTTEFVVLMPIDWRQRKHLKINDVVTFSARDVPQLPEGRLVNMGLNVRALNGRPMMLVTASIPGSTTAELAPGLIIDCTVACGNIKPGELLWRFARSLFN